MKYRKKPVVIEAYQTDKEMDIETLEGTMHASVGDYIITGVRGEKYPCKPDIFKQTYEPADASASPWHRVEDELPKFGEYVLAWEIQGFAVVDKYVGIGDGRWDLENDGAIYTHWMPLPEPPKEDA